MFMDTLLNSYILINPSFSTKGDKSFTLVCSEPSIGNSIKYFWNELARKGFLMKNDEDMITNFPMYIYDKQAQSLRHFIINQYLSKDTSKLKYNEISSGILLDKLTDSIGFDNYYNRLTESNFIINIDISKLKTDDQRICFPKFSRKLFLRY